jgi:hypothetical protein
MLDDTYQPAQRENSTVTVHATSTQSEAQSEAPTVEVCLSQFQDGNEIGIVSDVNALESRGFDIYDAWEKLQQRLADVGVRLHCCGNCRFLQLTGKSRQMSSGAKGYCIRYCRDHGRSRQDVVSIYDSCGEFTFGSQSFIKEIQATWNMQRDPFDASREQDDNLESN